MTSSTETTLAELLSTGNAQSVDLTTLADLFETLQIDPPTKGRSHDQMVKMVMDKERGELSQWSAEEILPYLNQDEQFKKEATRMLGKLYIKQQTEGAERSSLTQLVPLLDPTVDTTKLRALMYQRFIKFVAEGEKLIFPRLVPVEVSDAITKLKCKNELKFLKSASRKLLQKLAQTLQIENYLQLDKTVLCQAITDVNNVARTVANKTVTKCLQSLAEAEKIPTKSGEAKRQMASLKLEVQKLEGMIQQWESVQFYQTYPHCRGFDRIQQCADLFSSLHEFSARVTTQSNTCSKKVSKLKRMAKVGNLDPTSSLWQKFKAHVL